MKCSQSWSWNWDASLWRVRCIRLSHFDDALQIQVFCCCSPSDLWSDVLCIQKWCCAYFYWSELIFVLFSGQSAHSPLTSNTSKAFQWILPLTWPFSLNLKDVGVLKSLQIISFLTTEFLNNHAMFSEIQFLPHCDVQFVIPIPSS